ncbi:MAG: PAC2 family protein [Candidatus Omnitrophota bacterium]
MAPEGIKILKDIKVVEPVMIAGWPGMGNVALGTVDYLRRNMKTVEIAEIEIDKFSVLDSVIVENGVARYAEVPRNVFYYDKEKNIVMFEGEVQLQGAAGIALLKKVLEAAASFRTKMIFTGAAFPLPVSYREPPEVYGVANRAALLDTITKAGVKPMEGGHISGLNGLILGFAEERNIDALCLLATMPQYAISFPNPKASNAIIDALERILSFEVDRQEMIEDIKEMDERMSVIEDKVKDAFTIEDEAPETPPVDKKIPGYIMEKIEKMFREAKLDKTKAGILKKELDRWDLYKLYEDRFLDLFEEGQ